jgi:hypothetical protein
VGGRDGDLIGDAVGLAEDDLDGEIERGGVIGLIDGDFKEDFVAGD